ncbi:hypothetical protein AU825_01170 [Salmonella enterica subsp. salamae]|nr:hypothetical protein [Salmonella enterica]ECC3550923.1 hypothetical protein [Salmonella enterica subsp. salamae]ECG1030064.1 hypothetical protein [Salmonella enterica subsp. salamae]ECI4069883.1 hypothetical protein [Salmonella enterica subsp. salamae]EGO6394197.1 hypothetical protein [Salmonella enterica]
MKRFKEMAVILFFALLAAGFTSSAMADDPFSHVLDHVFDTVHACHIVPPGVGQPGHFGYQPWPWCW